MKKIEYNFRSACALGIISCFVLFLTASAPHRVHHLFENLPYNGAVPPKEAQPLTLNALAATGDDQGPLGDHHPTNEGHHRNGHHHKHASYGHNHKHDRAEQDHNHLEPTADNASDGDDHLPIARASDPPLHADRPHDDAHHDNSAQTVCLLQSAAQHAHLSAAQFVEISFLGIESAERAVTSFPVFSTFNPSPFSQRAPPKV